MTLNGTRSPNLTTAAVLSSVIGHSTAGGTRKQPIADLAQQLAQTSPLNLAGSQPAPLFATEVALRAAVIASPVSAWVYADPDPSKNGIWGYSAGDWHWTMPLPYSVIHAENVGAGTADAIEVTTRLPLYDGALVVIPIVATTTSDVVTVSVNDGPAIPVKTNGGNAPAAGGIVDQMQLLAVYDGAVPQLRLLNDQQSAAVVAAAEAAAAAAIAAKTAAELAASGVSLPAVAANRMLVDNAAGTARESKTFAQVRALLNVPPDAAAQNSILIGQADQTHVSMARDDAKAALSLFGLEDGKMMLFGLRPDKLTDTVIRIQPGMCADGALTPSSVMRLTSVLDVNIATVGLNGRDAGSATAGSDYFIYLLKNPTTGDVGAVLSSQISTSLVTKPAGYTLIRKLPWGIKYAPGGNVGFPNFHLSHWPLPMFSYTDSDDSANYRVLNAGNATTLTTFDLSGFVPDNARHVYLLCVLKGTADGYAYLRTGGTGGAGKKVGAIKANAESVMMIMMRVTSAAALSYRVDNAANNLSVYMLAFDQTEVS